MKLNRILYGLILISSSAFSEVSLESRAGITTPHSEGRPIVRFLSETNFTYRYDDFEVSLMGNIYGTQNWKQRVNQEDGLLKVDAVRFEYGADIRYWATNNFALYVRHTMPVDRNDKTIGDGWSDTSYRMDVGVFYKVVFK